MCPKMSKCYSDIKKRIWQLSRLAFLLPEQVFFLCYSSWNRIIKLKTGYFQSMTVSDFVWTHPINEGNSHTHLSVYSYNSRRNNRLNCAIVPFLFLYYNNASFYSYFNRSGLTRVILRQWPRQAMFIWTDDTYVWHIWHALHVAGCQGFSCIRAAGYCSSALGPVCSSVLHPPPHSS